MFEKTSAIKRLVVGHKGTWAYFYPEMKTLNAQTRIITKAFSRGYLYGRVLDLFS